jgi:hypothetical protein
LERLPQRVELPDGTVVWARLAVLPPPGGAYGDYEPVGSEPAEGVLARVDGLRETVVGVAASLRGAAAAARPDEVSVSFGVQLAVRAGRVVSVLADGEASASLSITLTWRHGVPPEDDEPAEPPEFPEPPGLPGTVGPLDADG